jgi:hypothetical protein
MTPGERTGEGAPLPVGPDLTDEGSLADDLMPLPERRPPLSPDEEMPPESDAAVIILDTPDLSLPESLQQMIEPGMDQGLAAYGYAGEYDQGEYTGEYDQGGYENYGLDDLYAYGGEPSYEYEEYDQGDGGYEDEGGTYAYEEPSYEYEEYEEVYA